MYMKVLLAYIIQWCYLVQIDLHENIKKACGQGESNYTHEAIFSYF